MAPAAAFRRWNVSRRRQWRKLSPSAELMVDPGRGARCAIRDTGASGAERYLWTVSVFGYHQWAAGRTRKLVGARSQTEAALAEYASARREMPGAGGGDHG